MGVIGYIFYVTGVIVWILILNFLALCINAYMPNKIKIFFKDTWFIIRITFTPYITIWRDMILSYDKSSYHKRRAFHIAKKIIEFKYKLLFMKHTDDILGMRDYTEDSPNKGDHEG